MPQNNNPRVSVVMPVYNTALFVGKAIESILGQTFKDFECIIVDDGSQDGSAQIIRDFAGRDSRIRILENDRNLGITKTRNRGISLASWTYIANFDSDDIASPDWLQTIYDFMETHDEVGVCGAGLRFIDKKWSVIGTIIYPDRDADIKASLRIFTPFANNTVFIRRSCFERYWLYDESIRCAEDLDLWIRLSTNVIFHNISSPLVDYRIHGNNSIILKRREIINNTWKHIRSISFFSLLRTLNLRTVWFGVKGMIIYSYVFLKLRLQSRQER